MTPDILLAGCQPGDIVIYGETNHVFQVDSVELVPGEGLTVRWAPLDGSGVFISQRWPTDTRVVRIPAPADPRGAAWARWALSMLREHGGPGVPAIAEYSDSVLQRSLEHSLLTLAALQQRAASEKAELARLGALLDEALRVTLPALELVGPAAVRRGLVPGLIRARLDEEERRRTESADALRRVADIVQGDPGDPAALVLLLSERFVSTFADGYEKGKREATAREKPAP